MTDPARDCAVCREYAADLADQFHPLSDVGPWDTACPACGHLCCGLEGSVGACDEDGAAVNGSALADQQGASE